MKKNPQNNPQNNPTTHATIHPTKPIHRILSASGISLIIALATGFLSPLPIMAQTGTQTGNQISNQTITSQLASLKLSQADIEDLRFAAVSFKQFFANTQADTQAINQKLTLLLNEQKVLNTELSQINDELRAEIAAQKDATKKQRKHMWIAIVAAGLLGIAL